MDWNIYRHEFAEADGLRQIIVTQVTAREWQKLFNFLNKTKARLTFYMDDIKSVMPERIENVFLQDGHQYRLALQFDGITLHCDFERHEDIVLKFDPAQVTNEAKATLLFRIMSTFGRRLRKVSILTSIGRETKPIFRYEHGQGLTYVKTDKTFALYEEEDDT